MIDRARSFALWAHGDQMYGDRPYAFHLDMVAGHLVPYGEQAQAVGYLHDVVEDTLVSREQIEAEFGPLVAHCVALLTDEPGATRRKRKARTYGKLARVSGPGHLALIVKTADRLANVQTCVAERQRSLWKMYRQEQPAFRQAVFRPGLCDPLWQELEALFDEAAPADG